MERHGAVFRMSKKNVITFEIFDTANKEFAWRLRHSNGKIGADSSETYKNKTDCENAVYSITETVSAGSYRVVSKVKKKGTK